MTAYPASHGQAPVTRFAPSPTGRLHLGHAYSAIRAHDRAREEGGRFLLRIEDIDGGRCREEHVAGIMEDLAWLELEWDGPVVQQSARLALYAAALARLRARGLVYPCFCTRAGIAREVAASASAPHGVEAVYPGTCRGLEPGEAERRMGPHAWRLDVAKALKFLPGTGSGTSRRLVEGGFRGPTIRGEPPSTIRCANGPPPRAGEELMWFDEVAGWVVADPLAHGDVVLARKDAAASYHLAVTVDDAAQGISHVVRGMDLFAATHVHRLLQALLALPTPVYHHHPLLSDANGERLAKRHGAPTLASLRAAGEGGSTLAASLRAGLLPIGFAGGKT